MSNKELQERADDILSHITLSPSVRSLIVDLRQALSHRIKNSVLNSTACKHIRTIHKLRNKLDAYKKALKTIAEWQSSSDSQDAIHAANTAIEALGDDYE